MAITDALPDMKRELKFFPADRTKANTLTHGQVDDFNEKGFLCPVGVMIGDEVERNRAYFDRLMELAVDAGLNSYSINGWHSSCAGVHDLVTNDRILDAVEDIIGPNLVCKMSHFFCKMPGDPKQVSWHQDASYWPLTPSKVVTVWLAIDDVDEEMGPMRVIPGTHVHGQIAFEHSRPEENNVLGQTVANADDFGDPVSFVMKAGQASLHTDLLLHGSEPNRSERRRCGLTLRYMPPDVRGRDPEHEPAVIARGKDVSGYWQHISRPAGDALPEKHRKR
ncbi:MAG: phytanoyl-CoA dioxygenase family protein [Candidatus Latescibacterota bacterium]|nr:phytanoyl-CoA dioxygenase family protein [Candidatus Latescibacterota bacterium]